MDRIDAMRAFNRIVERRSFTLAAQDLGLPRSTLTEAVQQMEARLGVRLLQRTTRQVRPTLDGEAYYRRCLSILADIEEAEIRLHRRHAQGHVAHRCAWHAGAALHAARPAAFPGALSGHPSAHWRGRPLRRSHPRGRRLRAARRPAGGRLDGGAADRAAGGGHLRQPGLSFSTRHAAIAGRARRPPHDRLRLFRERQCDPAGIHRRRRRCAMW